MSIYKRGPNLEPRKLEKRYDDLYGNAQKLVDECTAELVEANEELRSEIQKRKQAEKVLRESAKMLNVLLNATTNLILLIDVDGSVVTANDQACERYGKNLQEFIGVDIFSLMPPELAAFRKKMADIAIRSKHPVCCLEEIEGMFCNSIIYPILDDKNIVRNYSVFVQDITPLKLAEKALISSENNFRTLAGNAKDGIILVERDGNIVYVNREAEKLSGYCAPELLTIGMETLLDPAEKKNLCLKLRRKLAGEHVPDRYEVKLITKFGQAVPVEINVSKTIWQECPLSLLIVRDITSQKQTEAELIREQIKLEHRVKERTKEIVETNRALSVLARNIDRKGEKVQEQITRTVNSKIWPIIEALQNNKTFSKHRTELDLLETYLKEITVDFKKEMRIIFTLSNSELRIASMVKDGFTSPEIARLLNISPDTVKTHRKNIRKKLNINNSKINLRTYLRNKLN